jgi:predicted acetyltransferase
LVASPQKPSLILAFSIEQFLWLNSLMNELSLVDPHPRYQDALLDMYEDFEKAGEVNPDIYSARKDFEAYVRSLQEASHGHGLAEGWVPYSTHWLSDDKGELLGESHLRYHLTPGLAIVGGHIGYRIRPSARRKGYGTLILAFTLDRARAIGLPRVLVTCDSDNIGSRRIIEKNAGVLTRQFFHASSQTSKNHYWIDLLRPAGVQRLWQPNGKVTQTYQAAYPEAMIVQAGEELSLGRRDSEWPGWIWCTNANGQSGWIPENYLDERGGMGRARRDYATAELSVKAGQPLMLHLEESGWYWTTDEQGYSGWVPKASIARY